MESVEGKEFEECGKSQEEMIPSSRTKEEVNKGMNDDEGTASTSTSSRRPQPNPLLIDLVLDVILPKLPLKDLLSCRLVCQLWNRMSTPKVKTQSPERIITSEDHLFIWRDSDSTRFDHFVDTMRTSPSIPFGKFEFRLLQSYPDLSIFQELIDVCSNEITSLHLAPMAFPYHPPTSGPATNPVVFQNWLKQLKNLTKLTITDFDFGITSCSTIFEPGNDGLISLDNLREFHFLGVVRQMLGTRFTFFDGFFITAQNLERISFGVKDPRVEWVQVRPRPSNDFEDNSDEERQLRELFDIMTIMGMNQAMALAYLHLNVVLNSFLNHGKLDGIKSLSLHNLEDVNLTTLIQIGKKGLKLESLQIQGEISLKIDSIELYDFLETQKNSLKTLEISGGRVYYPELLVLKFPTEMKELLSLTLFCNGPLQIQEPICYASKFPKIRQLRVKCGRRSRDYRQDVEILDALFPGMENLVRCETMKELRMTFILSDQERIVEDEIIQRVSGIFPGLGIRVQVDRAGDEIVRAREMTLEIFSD